MQDPQDTSTADLPLDTPEQPTTTEMITFKVDKDWAAPEQPTPPPSAEPAKRKATPRAKYTEAFVVKCQANRDPEHPSLMLLKALMGCGVAHKAVDQAFNWPEGTVQKYLTTGKNVELAPGVAFDDGMALIVFDMLSDLHEAQAFKGNDLTIAGVLRAMMAFKTRVDE